MCCNGIMPSTHAAGIALTRLHQIVTGVLGATAALRSDTQFTLQFVKVVTTIGNFTINVVMRNTATNADNHG